MSLLGLGQRTVCRRRRRFEEGLDRTKAWTHGPTWSVGDVRADIVRNSEHCTKLAQELSIFEIVQDFTTVNLEHLPLLNAVIRESLRLCSPVSGPRG